MPVWQATHLICTLTWDGWEQNKFLTKLHPALDMNSWKNSVILSHRIVLSYSALCSTTLHSAQLLCTVLSYSALCSATPYCAQLLCTVLSYSALCSATQHFLQLLCTVLSCFAQCSASRHSAQLLCTVSSYSA